VRMMTFDNVDELRKVKQPFEPQDGDAYSWRRFVIVVQV